MKTEQVIFIKGIAESPEYRNYEELWAKNCITCMSASGIAVTVVGNAYMGFSLKEIATTLKKKAREAVIVLQAHGEADDTGHFFAGGHKDKIIKASDFYETVARVSNNEPRDITMMSCGSGNGLTCAKELLPKESALLSLSRPGAIESRSLRAAAFSLPVRAGRDFSELFFINMVRGGMLRPNYVERQLKEIGHVDIQEKEHIDTTTPMLTVIPVAKKGKTYDLWDLTIKDCCRWSGNRLENGRRELLEHTSAGCLPATDLANAVALMEHYSALATYIGRDGTEARHIVRESTARINEIFFTVDNTLPKHNVFLKGGYEATFEILARESGMFGLICAGGYFLHRDEMGAFRSQPPSRASAMPS
jgi:hypothetical protein